MEKQFDVIVARRPAPPGIAAAVSAARCGANTALIERYGILGGMMTSGAVHPILGNTAPNTMYQEVCALLNEGHENVPKDTTRNGSEIHVDPEEAKYRLLKLVCNSGVKLYLQTPIADVCKDGDRVTGVTVVHARRPGDFERKVRGGFHRRRLRSLPGRGGIPCGPGERRQMPAPEHRVHPGKRG